jgi:hypothetical protein
MQLTIPQLKAKIERLEQLAFQAGNSADKHERSADFAAPFPTKFSASKAVNKVRARGDRYRASLLFSKMHEAQCELEDRRAYTAPIPAPIVLSPEACQAIAELHLGSPEKAPRKEEIKALDGTRYQLPRRA